MKANPPRKSRSGTQWTDADYAAHGYGRIMLRLPVETLVELGRLAAKTGLSRAALVAWLIDNHS